MNKKLVAVLVIILLALGGFGLSKLLFPKGEAGTKEVTVNIIVANENIDYTKSFKTDALYVEELLNENTEELKVVTEDTQYGPMLVGLLDYKADATKEFYSIKINGEDAMVGIKEIPVNDGDEYTFEVQGF